MNRLKAFVSAALLLAAAPALALRTVDSLPVPAGFTAAEYPAGSYSQWIRSLPLKHGLEIRDHEGRPVNRSFYQTWAVAEMPLMFQGDLEQCADWAMRFWAEYHRSAGKLDKLYLFDYNGRKKTFKSSGKTFRKFLKWAFDNTNSYSLKKGCAVAQPDKMRAGDMVVQNEKGGIGHVSIVMGVCKGQTGEALFLMGFSYMPAQEFHIERAPEGYGKEGWFTLEGYYRYLNENMNLGRPVLRRFELWVP
jgi:hypothetical protein